MCTTRDENNFIKDHRSRSKINNSEDQDQDQIIKITNEKDQDHYNIGGRILLSKQRAAYFPW